jgi:hypothetical protein
MSRGWALGTKEFKAALIKNHPLVETSRAWEATGAREMREARWSEDLTRGLKLLRKSNADVLSEMKSAPWKVAQ